MNNIKKIKYLIITFSIIAGLTFWFFDALMHKLAFSDEPFLKILMGNDNEVAVRSLTCLFFLVFGVIAAKAFSDQKRTEDLLRASEEKFRSLVESTNDSIYLVDKDCKYLYMNKKHVVRMGFTGQEYLGRSYNEYHLPNEIRCFSRDFDEVFSTGKSIQREHKSRRDGKYFLQTLSPVMDAAGGILGVTVVSKDISGLKLLENKFHALSVTDELTGLFNRRGFFTVADQYLKLADRNKKGTFMLYVDLDGLKLINDKFGHSTGDLALIELANLLKNNFRNSDAIARIGGDEFVVFPVEITEDNIETITARFKDSLKSYNEKADYDFKLSACVGTAYYDPEHPHSLEELLIQADKDMYDQKNLRTKA
jgi:diguanylate cyclase (GGDEF)-like protein/PAS domain S-box-containing protein